MTAKVFWNDAYINHPIDLPNESDPMLLTALDYFGEVRGARLLDLGCGNGRSSLFFAKQGADVVAIDFSDIAIQNLTQFCQDNGISNITPVQCSAFDIATLGTFDFIFGNMILHHLEPFDAFCRILQASLTPNGKAYFRENSAMSSLLVWFRENMVGKFGIPKKGDDDEFPLTPTEVEQLRHYFEVDVNYSELFFFRLASEYLLKGRLQSFTYQLDQLLFQLPHFRKYSYRQNLFLKSLPS